MSEVLHRIADSGMTLRLNKCSFFSTSAKFLGFVIDRDGIRPDPRRAEAIFHYKRPSSRTEVLSFLGVVNYYRTHVPRCAHIAAPLHELTKKTTVFDWDEAEQASTETQTDAPEPLVDVSEIWNIRKQIFIFTRLYKLPNYFSTNNLSPLPPPRVKTLAFWTTLSKVSSHFSRPKKAPEVKTMCLRIAVVVSR